MKWSILSLVVLSASISIAAAAFSMIREPERDQDDLDERMQGYRKALGVGCKHCHIVGEEEKWTRNKLVAKYMQTEYADKLSVTENGEKKKLTCEYCHKGKAKIIDRTPPPKSEAPSYGPGAGAGPNANKMQKVMNLFTKGLGVSCNYCHEAMRWTADNGRKKTAKEMLNTFSAKLIRSDDKKLSCASCHNGKTKFLPNEKDADRKNNGGEKDKRDREKPSDKNKEQKN